MSWLGVVPRHWKQCRMKTVLRERSEKGFPDEPLLAATQTKGVVRKENFINRTVMAMKDLHLLKLVCIGDFVISLRSFQGGIEYAREQGIISPAYTVMYPVKQETQRYLVWLFKSKPFIENLTLFVTGIRQGQSIDYEKLSRSDLPIPPISEQAAIVRFLDHIDRRILRCIRAKQKLITLLEEQKQAIIRRVVTRGINTNIRVKPSGVEWLGDIPIHWEIKPIRRWASINKHVLSETTDPNYEFSYLDIGTIGTGVIVRNPERIQFGNAPSRARRILRQGDTIISTVRTYLKAIYFIHYQEENIVASTGFAVLTPNPSIEHELLSYVVQANYVVDQITAHSIGIAYPAINESRLASFKIALPPDRHEQREILDYIKLLTKDLDIAIKHNLHGISLLREYRTRLIADVVTGKLDVREAAASLPEEIDLEEAESLDDEGELAGGGESANIDVDASEEKVEA